MIDDPRMSWASLSRADRDRAYDHNGAVSNSADLIAERNARSAAIRAARGGALDVPYGHRPRMRVDLYPAETPDAPCLVFIHGGYWLRNSREVFAMIVEGVAAHGWSVAIPSYTLAPEATLAQISDEIATFLDWLAAEAPARGIGGPNVLSGWSAGAQLAALHVDHPAVTAGLAISGVYDLGPVRDLSMNETLRLSDDEIERLSPVRLPAARHPLVIAYGTDELAVTQHDALQLHQRRERDGAPGALIAIPAANHFTILDELRRPAGRLVDVVVSLTATS